MAKLTTPGGLLTFGMDFRGLNMQAGPPNLSHLLSTTPTLSLKRFNLFAIRNTFEWAGWSENILIF